MLSQLNISDFAVIKRLEITFMPGLNILSGETGAGKSIIINAMNLVLGGRASSELIRHGAKEARVEALFSLPGNGSVQTLLKEQGFDFEGDLIIRRTITREGRNRIAINDSLATVQTLGMIGAALVSISGQHEHQVLLRPENHLSFLDSFGGLMEERGHLKDLLEAARSLDREIRELQGEVRETEDQAELRSFQIQEIERAALSPGEEGRLGEERRRLQNAETLRQIVLEGYQALYESRDSVSSVVSAVRKKMEKGSEMDVRLGPVRDALDDIGIRVEDAALLLRDLQKTVEPDPVRLDQVEERLQLLGQLKRKYGGSIEAVIDSGEKLASFVADLGEKRERIKMLEAKRAFAWEEIAKKGMILSKKRRKAALRLEEAMEAELRQLHMEGTRFSVRFRTDTAADTEGGQGERRGDAGTRGRGDAGTRGRGDAQTRTGAQEGEETPPRMRVEGMGQAEFMISPNPGEGLGPLSRIASGGELSRVMLGLKTILAQSGSVETIIFDEVDSGISGATAEVIGEKLLNLSGFHQILCITHLPQIASKGETHFLVKKVVSGGRTEARLLELEGEARVREIARLLAGKEITATAVAHAEEMLG
jgi:DNA repair protein RecN (Recombination protein N)